MGSFNRGVVVFGREVSGSFGGVSFFIGDVVLSEGM